MNLKPLTNKDRDIQRGIRIKQVRTDKKLSQVNFGKAVTNNPNIDRKTIYDWERGKFCPNEDTLQKIAEMGNTDINEILYGTLEDYIHGLITKNDSLIQNDISSTDLSVPDYLKYTNRAVSASLFKELDSQAKNKLISKIIINCNKLNLTHLDTVAIVQAVDNFLMEESMGDISILTQSILDNLDIIETEWLPEQLQDNMTDTHFFPIEGINKLYTAIESFRDDLNKINDKYSNIINKKGGAN
ncbi:helix-turn-helix transcriptional regulator [Vagococcus fluvialis]|uniref:helix-turn-helix transcriptional regulator n=1 Tax=Vagococcus fluvialis TaxID=2738 RepID=UPI001A8F0DB8|nr:helix-turn-helix transcriptional regulator [Vagococcus fluvialis]MBO0480170.1 helix-turn-helix transcriptional regulator [Vagococcus fluvialis]MBO0483935.1 helix-turn-helix transcriptional regulator [Vagococcus fluvialis]